MDHISITSSLAKASRYFVAVALAVETGAGIAWGAAAAEPLAVLDLADFPDSDCLPLEAGAFEFLPSIKGND